MSRDAAANSAVIRAVPTRFDAVPGQSRLFLSFLSEQTPESKLFWPHRDDSLSDYSKITLENYATDRDQLCDALVTENEAYGATTETLSNIARLRDKDCVAVVTGQQAGFLGGPAYTVYKALSAIQIASDLMAKGVNAVPVFWIATEDHDFEEISKVNFRDGSGSIVSGEIVQTDSDLGKPVGDLQIGAETVTSIERIFSRIPKTQFTSDLEGLSQSCFETGSTLGLAFGRLLTSILGRHGLVFVNPLNPVIRELSSDVFVLALEHLEEISNRLSERDKLLKEQGKHSQVQVSRDFVPFFAFDKEGRRKALEFAGSNGKIVSKDGELEFTRSELKAIARNEPSKLSPNALMRPVVQDTVFPTVCYVGGAAEICYFAQNSVIYDVLGLPVTPARHRSAFTILEARHRRTMRAYEIEFMDLFDGHRVVTNRLAEKIADPAMLRLFEETEDLFESRLAELEAALSKQDPHVANNLIKRRKKIVWHIQSLRKKFIDSQAKKNKDLTRRVGDLFESVMPGGVLQERTVTYLDFLNLHGPNFSDWIYGHVDGDGNCHKALFF